MDNPSNITLKIKKEFKNLIRPLHRQEYLQLEENILKDGCREAIITWDGYIIDGHNRYEICRKHNIPFKTTEMEFVCVEDAIAWICANQLGRRNISEETRKFLIGMQYESEKIVSEIKNPKGQNQYTTTYTGDFIEGELKKMPYASRSRHKTASRIAKDNNISTASVQKYASYTRALAAIGRKEPELVPKILSGRYKISHKNVIELSRLPAVELTNINKRMNCSQSPFFQYSTTRHIINDSTGQDLITTSPTIKDMPSFDPDAEVTELTLTIPSWVSSIKRTQSNAKINMISDTAKYKLIDALESLKNMANELLVAVKEEKE